MELMTLGSSSAGNCYILRATSGETLILECGLPFRKIKEDLGWNLSGITACLISHRHRDHCKAFPDMEKAGIRTLALQDVKDSFPQCAGLFFTPLDPMKGYKAGGFRIFTLPVYHSDPDGNECPCLGFVINHDEMGKLLFVTDAVTLDYNVEGLDHIMIEANYSDRVLQGNIDAGRIHKSERDRLIQSHMEIETTIKVLQTLDTDNVNEVILLHLSPRNSNPDDFIRQVSGKTGIPTHVAKEGLKLDLNSTIY